MIAELKIITIGNDTCKNQKRLKINLFTPAPIASLKLRESEEGE
jgi:hypothetical protein